MKIGILTHPLRSNCGGILQNYALQKTLLDMGHDVFTIDRHHDHTPLYDFFSWVSRLVRFYILKKNVPIKYKLLPSRKEFIKENKVFNTFIENHINRTEYIPSDSQLKKINSMGFDAIVVGSDQIWSREYAPASFLSFLTSEHTLRISYAASFGKDLAEFNYPENLVVKCKKELHKFKAVSVREKSGVEICRQVFGVQAIHVLDPTFLLTPKDYSLLCENIRKMSRPFLFSYILDRTDKKIEILNQVAEILELSIVDFYSLGDQSIERWISCFRDASFVITDSFHGMAFSINFGKQFIAINNSKRGSTRFLSLLSQLNLCDRLIEEKITQNDLNTLIRDNIDFQIVQEKLIQEKESSRQFLKNALLK